MTDPNSPSIVTTTEAIADRIQQELGRPIVLGAASLIEWRSAFYILTISQPKYWKEEQGHLTISIGCPGGKLEKDEDFCNAAIRESQEEIGMTPNLFSSSITTYFDPEGEESSLNLTNRICPFLIHCTTRRGTAGKAGMEGSWTLFSAMYRAIVSDKEIPINNGGTGGLLIIPKEKFASFPEIMPIEKFASESIELRPAVDIPNGAYLTLGPGLRYAQIVERRVASFLL